MSGLDMSRLCDNWMPTEGHPELVASLPFSKILKLDMTIEHSFPPAHPRILLLQAEVEGQEIWGLRLWNGHLRLDTGHGAKESAAPYGYESTIGLRVSYNPAAGGLTVLYNKDGATGGSFSVNVENPWLPKTPYYTLRIGAPKHYVDHGPLGWTISADYRLCNPPLSAEEQVPHAPDMNEEEEGLLSELFLGYDPKTERVVHSEPGLKVVAPLVEVSPLDSLRLALQSIDSWRKVAEGALEALEKGAPS